MTSLLLFLDFDGTLARLSRDADRVFAGKRMRALLRRLARKPGFRVVIVSGRSLEDLRQRVGVQSVVLAGNHGIELEGKVLFFGSSKRLRRSVRLAARRAERDLGRISGVRIEDKRYTLSVHYRNVPPSRLGTFRRAFAGLRRRTTGPDFSWLAGKKVWDFLPRPHGHKADVVRHFRKRFPKALSIAVGDDRTDEDMFRAIGRRGVAVRVGRVPRSAARHFVTGPGAVARFLERLCRL